MTILAINNHRPNISRASSPIESNDSIRASLAANRVVADTSLCELSTTLT